MQDRQFGGDDGRAVAVGAAFGRAAVDLTSAFDGVAQQAGELVQALLVELERRPQDDRRGMIEPAAVRGRGDAREDVLEVLPEDAAAGRARELLPVRLAEPDGGDRAVEVLQRASARLG